MQQDDKILYQRKLNEQKLKRVYGGQSHKVLAKQCKLQPTVKDHSTFLTVMQNLEYKLEHDYRDIFTQIYPLQSSYNDPRDDKYRKIALQLKNPFMTNS